MSQGECACSTALALYLATSLCTKSEARGSYDRVIWTCDWLSDYTPFFRPGEVCHGEI